MRLNILRIVFIIAAGLGGFLVGRSVAPDKNVAPLIGAIASLAGGIVIVLAERSVPKPMLLRLAWGMVGLALGLVAANLAACPLYIMASRVGPGILLPAVVGLNLVFGYAGLLLGLRGSVEFARRSAVEAVSHGMKLLDTSVIIDGRIADICDTGFVEGELVVPRFVLRELQSIADSSDTLKRRRGRRGLEILQRLQKSEHVSVAIEERDFPQVREVDGKLVKLGRVLGAKIITNDYNLNRVAELQEVEVLNTNELANALRPVVLPGELMSVRLIKEGKEAEQGVGYLDDGTMVVVENGRKLLGQTVQVVVTSVLQTSAGRMIFGRPNGDSGRG